MGIYAKDVQKLYVAFFNRPADPIGLAYWEDQVTKNGGSTAAVANAFSASAEYKDLFAGKSTAQIIDTIYQNLFGRAAEAAGLTYWGVRLENGTFNIGNIATSILVGAQGDDKKVVDNKATAADLFTSHVDTAAEMVAYSGTAAAATARAWLATVSATDASLTTATGTADASISTITSTTVSNGTTFTLTTGVDIVNGTAGNDTFATADTTLSAADQINGGAGTDVLSFTYTGAGAALPAASITGVETLNLRNVGTGALTLDASTIAGVTAINADRSTQAVTLTNLAASASVGVIGDGTVANNAVNFAYASATTPLTINVAGGTKVGAVITNTGVAPTTATINSTGAANTTGIIDLGTGTAVTSLTVNAATNLTSTLAADYAATAALTVTGAAASVDLGSVGNFKTIDASGLTAGGLTITGGSNLTSFKGGQGNDVFTTAAAYGVTTAGIVNAGTGTDVLVLSATTDMDTAAEAALYTGFETLRTAGSQDMSLLSGITAVQVGATTGVLSQMNATQAAATQVRVAATSATFALADSTGTSDVLNLSMGTGTTTAAATGFTGAVTINGFETLNITTNAGATATAGANQTAVFGTAFTADKLTAINLKGQSVTLTDAATTKAVTIDASALTGNGTTGLTLGGNLVAGSTVIGSGIADAITLGTVGSTYNTGAGNDSISGTLAQIRTGATYNTIDAGAGTDTVNITGGAALTMVDDDFKGLTGVEKITVATTSANNQSITTGGWFDAGFKATGATLTTTTTTGSVDVVASSFTGNLTVVSTSGAVTGGVNIATGSGNDSVTVTAASITTTSAISTGAGNDTIVGSVAVETITGGTGADTMTGGGGVDIFAFGTNGSVIGTSMDIITDFNTAGADVLTFGAATTVLAADATALVAGSNVQQSAGGLVTFATADNTLALKIAAVQADVQLDAAGSVAMFVDGANTYVYYAGAAIGNADDQLVQLTGITSLVTITGGATTTIA